MWRVIDEWVDVVVVLIIVGVGVVSYYAGGE